MRISLIKANISDSRLSALLGKDVWEIPCCKAALESNWGSEGDIDLVFCIVKSAMLNDLSSTDKASNDFARKKKSYNSILRRFSKLLYGDSLKWKSDDDCEIIREVFGFSEEYLEKRKKAEEIYAALSFLYDRLGIEPIPKYDVVKLISKDEAVSKAVLLSKESILSKKDLYSLAEPILIERCSSGSYTMKDQILTRSLSRLAYKDLNYFFTRNGFEPLQTKPSESDENREFVQTEVYNPMENSIELREINKLIKERFYIPTYQRGYRWDRQQVTELLEDIYEFIHKRQGEEFYCLQPIVVKANRQKGYYEVIDGQQRLTTIYIIQKYLKKRTFHIEYATREGSEDYLEHIDTYAESEDEITERFVDYFFMSSAYKTVSEWFEKIIEKTDDYTLEDEFNTHLGKYCKVIWYEVDENAESESIFTRLNIGKIPLTNAELIKALLLRKGNFDSPREIVYQRQLEIANEWDTIENSLQDDKLWYFINPANSENLATRIELIFDMISGKTTQDYSTFTFVSFAKMLESGSETIVSIWKKVKDYFRIINEWYSDQRLYHLIGFLTSSKSNVTVPELIKVYYSKEYKKNEFEHYVIQRIRQHFRGVDIEELSYEADAEQAVIKDILLLFNVVTVMNKSSAYSRFPFDSFNKNRKAWSLEHIHAQNSQGIGKNKALWIAWIDEHLKSFRQFTDERYKDVVELLESVDRDNITEDDFEELFDEIQYMIQDDYGVDLHSIDNLALLDRNANSSISNNFFDVKRSMIIEKDRSGEFIPVCTRNVFLKYYSKDPSQVHYWSASDRRDYLDAIKNTIAPYYKAEVE